MLILFVLPPVISSVVLSVQLELQVALILTLFERPCRSVVIDVVTGAWLVFL